MAAGGSGRPRVVLSRCLEVAACRYDGRMIRSEVVRLLERHVELVPVCPEVEIGLGVPRDPIRLVGAGPDGGGELRLVQPSTDRDLTDRMTRFGHAFADAVGAVDGLLLKSRSPSCGVGDAKRYARTADESPVATGAGMFAAIMMARFPAAVVEDEVRLMDPAVRDRFLERLSASAAARAADGPG